ncbi:alpha/beta hydrolase [Loktanella sp. S4079]|uniref:alpha/beta hydrolase n=1 Tax=Loktanella sp. S4079 TaxID=579483 RepID=UPI0005F9C179|nr:alpha/beta hydrolase [Loktanella sp. S4079]KJZ20730.1 esterase [Loktanella sp. S4079]
MELDEAFANAAYIPDGMVYPDRWAAEAAAYRALGNCTLDLPYGPGERHRFDLFLPASNAQGLVVFVHGGYWRQFDKSYWSHLAAGPVTRGWAVAVPSYDLCPHCSIPEIRRQIAQSVAVAAERISGPIVLAGHSAGGQLVGRLAALGSTYAWQKRVARIFMISPVCDLSPLMRTSMNEDLKIDADIAAVESPLNLAAPSCPVTIWVGADERPIFIGQSQDLAQAWRADLRVEGGKHHFDVISDMTDPRSEMSRILCGEM